MTINRSEGKQKAAKVKKSRSKKTSNEDKKTQTDTSSENLHTLIAKQTLEDMEKLSENLRFAAITGSKIGESIAGMTKDYFEKHPKMDPLGLAPYTAEVTSKIASKPEQILEAQQKLWNGYAEIWADMVKDGFGDKNPVEDKRFTSPEWQSNIMFDMLRRTYLHTSNWLLDLVNNVDDVDDLTKRKASFFTQQMANAFSPANFLLTNPVALKEMYMSQGESVVRGMTNMLSDFQRGNGRLSLTQTDLNAFQLGKNLAITPGKVVHRGTLFELIQYSPTTEKVYEIPLLIFPPWINKYYVLDLREDNSMIRWLVSKGYTVFVVSWVNPTAELAKYGFEEYVDQAIIEAIDAVQNSVNTPKVNCVGYCIGGTLLATAAAYMAKTGDDRINSVTFFASQQDFIESGDLKIFTDDAAYKFIADEIEYGGGVLDAKVMTDTFNYLRSNDLIWSFVINNYLMGKAPKPFDLLYWNSDQTRMPKTLHLFYLEKFYRNNDFAEGRLKIHDENLNLKEVKFPVYMQASKEDHIAPYRSIFRGAKLFGGEVRMILAGSGHIAGVVNHPDANKYQHWLPKENGVFPDNVDDWVNSLTEHKGSWWNDWNIWLGNHSGAMVNPRIPGDGKLEVICDAPGTYVLMK
jgi:polyhydroxyalkanoate synthase